ncbi:MAG TPA: helix-turn-helix domain-containing protein [Mycobacterium sp.]|uniref:helix-turn-helix domain-containing protein n=1 Tax=Mycobacterium sp. TaxID=1785 RepID=UPI002F3E6A3B
MSLDVAASRVHRDTPRRLPPAALRLLAELQRRAVDTPDGAVLAPLAELAESLNVSERTIQRARGRLAGVGLIVVDGPEERYTPNTYRVVRH